MPEVNILDCRKAHKSIKTPHILMPPYLPMVPFLIKAIEFRIAVFTLVPTGKLAGQGHSHYKKLSEEHTQPPHW